MEPRKVYLQQAIATGVCLAASTIILGLRHQNDQDAIFFATLPLVSWVGICGCRCLEQIDAITKYTHLASKGGAFLFYLLLLLFSPVAAPVYLIFNVVMFLRTPT